MELKESPRAMYSENPSTVVSALPSAQILSRFADGYARLGRVCGEELFNFKDQMRAAGFVDVVETRYRLPIGAWPTNPIEREVGRYHMLNCLEALEGYSLALCMPDIGADPEEVRVLARGAEQDILNRRLLLYGIL